MTKALEDRDVPTATSFTETIHKSCEIACKALEKAKDMMKRSFDKKKVKPKNYEDGDLVLVLSKNLLCKRGGPKLNDKWQGPFKVPTNVGENAYKLKMPVHCQSSMWRS